MKGLPLILAVIVLIAPAAAVAQDTRHAARLELAHSMANMTLSILTDPREKVDDRQSLLKNSFAQVVDIDWIARFVLGNAWRTASDEEKERYTALYRRYLTHVYVSTYAESSERKIRDIKVIDVRGDENDRYIARTQVELSTNEKLDVDYLVAEQNGSSKIIDVVIEGVSLLATHRREFAELAAARGVSGVIEAIEERLDGEIRLAMNE